MMDIFHHEYLCLNDALKVNYFSKCLKTQTKEQHDSFWDTLKNNSLAIFYIYAYNAHYWHSYWWYYANILHHSKPVKYSDFTWSGESNNLKYIVIQLFVTHTILYLIYYTIFMWNYWKKKKIAIIMPSMWQIWNRNILLVYYDDISI